MGKIKSIFLMYHLFDHNPMWLIINTFLTPVNNNYHMKNICWKIFLIYIISNTWNLYNKIYKKCIHKNKTTHICVFYIEMYIYDDIAS